MDLPGHQQSATRGVPLHNLPEGPKRLTVQKISSSMAIFAMTLIGHQVGNGRWNFEWLSEEPVHSLTLVPELSEKAKRRLEDTGAP
jgi:hypothetical protein